MYILGLNCVCVCGGGGGGGQLSWLERAGCVCEVWSPAALLAILLLQCIIRRESSSELVTD